MGAAPAPTVAIRSAQRLAAEKLPHISDNLRVARAQRQALQVFHIKPLAVIVMMKDHGNRCRIAALPEVNADAVAREIEIYIHSGLTSLLNAASMIALGKTLSSGSSHARPYSSSKRCLPSWRNSSSRNCFE